MSFFNPSDQNHPQLHENTRRLAMEVEAHYSIHISKYTFLKGLRFLQISPLELLFIN